MKWIKKLSLVLTAVTLLFSLGACHQSRSKTVSKATLTQHVTKKRPIKKTAHLSQQVFQLPQGDFQLTTHHITNSATKNKLVFILRYTFTNKGHKQVVSSDLWYKYIQATQTINGKTTKLTQGSLPFSTAATKDDDLENASVEEVKPKQQVRAEGSWELVKNGAPVLLKFYDPHHQLVGTRQYATN
ncbi:DUF5067 domain-containing protein [Pediococcus siamensis]|uniref:DUF5067 domain-containing protein n=1 Tax=Pediococcus siamensis TaxID=381829 RepID=UPI0039A19DBE